MNIFAVFFFKLVELFLTKFVDNVPKIECFTDVANSYAVELIS